VPINIVSRAPFTDTRQAVQAPQTVSAQAPEPTPAPKAKPAPPAPTPAPIPAFTQLPTRAAPKPVKPQTQAPSLKAAAPQAPSLDFNHLQQIIQNAQRSAGPPTSSAQRGPPRAETAPQARPDAGQGVSQSDMQGLEQLLERLWNPNCGVPGGAGVKLQVKFTIGLDGRVLGRPNAGGLERSGDAVLAAAARRAIDAVQQAEPYSQPYYGQTIIVNFDAKEACAKQ
jgi:hypothetical protein